jgi:hypothetical protein
VRLAAGGVAGEPLAYVLVGDGRTDAKVLGAICEKYDHCAALVHPEVPLHRGRTGLAVVDALTVLFDQLQRGLRFLVILDKEHVGRAEDFLASLRERGFAVLSVKECSRGYWLIDVERGGKRGLVVLSVQGERKSIEENLAKLARLIKGDEVAPSKHSLKKWLREHGYRSWRELLESARREDVEEAFPSMTSALRALLSLLAEA